VRKPAWELPNVVAIRQRFLQTVAALVLGCSGVAATSGVSGASVQTVKDAKYELAFSLPNGWRQIPLSGKDVSGLLDLVARSDPSMKSALTKEVKQAVRAGITIFALGPISNQFASNINVIVEPQSSGPSTSGYFDELGVEVKLNLASVGSKHISTSTVKWTQGKVLQATYTLHLSSPAVLVEGLQDYVWHKGKVFIVTFSSSKLSTDRTVAELVGRSWHWS